jgi:hypothetical protein
LIKDDILSPLDFSNSDYCIDYIKGKYAKQVKKGEAKRSAGVLEIIHMDICGSFTVKSVNSFDSFITFTDDFSWYGYIYPIKERSEVLDKFKVLSSNFDMKDLGEALFVLGIKIHRDRSKGVLGLSQKAYLEKVLKKFSMHACNPTPAPIVKGDKYESF